MQQGGWFLLASQYALVVLRPAYVVAVLSALLQHMLQLSAVSNSYWLVGH